MLRNKKGFTLVELLAVIVILAIILAIAVPTISTLIKNQRKAAFEAGIKMLIKGVQYEALNGTTYSEGATVAPTTFGGSTADYGANITIVDAITNAGSPVKITVTGAGQFANCSTTGATLGAVTVTGSGCV